MAHEENFPRGGKVVRKRRPQENDNLFNTAKPPKPKKQKKSKRNEPIQSSNDVFESSLNIRGSLKYDKIQVGMVILGCVRHITNFSIEVELPGLCFASVNITEISDPFTKHLNQLLENNEAEASNILNNLFSIGDFLPVKIVSIEAREKGNNILGSINPQEIYSGYNHNAFRKDMLVWSSISSQSDHGYEMNMGIKNCRAFLPSKNINPQIQYDIGHPVWCVVHKVDATASASILRLSAKSEHIKSAKLEIQSLDNITPGTKVQLVVDKVTQNGIQGKFADNFIGYVNENYLVKPLKKLSEYQEGKLLTAYVLFVEPTTKITHLTLRFPEREDKPDLNVGDIVQGKVFGKASNGVYFTLPENLKGFAANKRLINTLPKQDNIRISDAISSKYSMGSNHQCRIMDYNFLSKTFICTPEHSVIKENTFLPTDLTPGQLVSVKIVAIKEEGIVVTTGHVRGFVTNQHISNIEHTTNVKKKFKEGQQFNARVLSIENDNVLFTFKPSLVENDLCLTKLEDAEIGNKYPGVVTKISETGALVVFYNNIKGWISKIGMGREVTDPAKYFFIGQVVSIYVWKIESTHIILSLFRPQVKSALPNVGGRYCGIVKAINDDGIHVQIEDSKRKGLVPNLHLCSSQSLCLAMKKTFKVGDKVPDLMYVGGVKPQIFSKREGAAVTLRRIPALRMLKEGSIIRCSYQSTSDEGIYVLPHIQDYTELVLIPKMSMGKQLPELIQHQLVMAKIEKLDIKNKELGLSIGLNDVFDTKIETTINLFTQYLVELVYLYQHGKINKWGICNYQPGRQVTCTVEKIGPQGGCVVTLPNGVKGIAVPSLCPKSVKVGETLQGMVLAHEFEKEYLDVCLKPDIFSKINPVQDGEINSAVSSSISEKLLVKDECIIAILKHSDGNKQMVYLPEKLHQNDFEGCDSYYEDKKFKVCVCGRIKKFLIGMSKKLFLRLDKSTQRQKVHSLISGVLESQVGAKSISKNIRKEKPQKPKKEAQPEAVQENEPLTESDSGIEHEENNDVEIETELDDEIQMPNLETNTEKGHINSGSVALPGVSSFFNTVSKEQVVEDSSSEDEDNGPTEKKKKKLSPAERAELIRQEEDRISRIEKELADPTKAPESADQFDRLLLAKPDSAELWAQYIAFHIAATEIEKARAVAKKALDTINMTLTEEKFKIWMVLLNLENMFGTKESFDKSFEDALKFNDSLQVYLKVIEMLAENAKYSEMEEKINKVRLKHKQESTMWIEVGKTYFQIGNFKDARSCKERALKSISDKKSQMSIIIRFAIMEFKYGEPDQGSAIFETILMSDPRKVNIWVTYVDQLIKKEQIDEARQVLERAICQKLPLKSMKSLFMKFRKFEEVHGTPETVENVKQRAQDYVLKFK